MGGLLERNGAEGKRVAQATARALEGRDPLGEPAPYLGGAAAGAGPGVVFAPLADIVALHGADDYVEIEPADGRRLLTRKSMRGLEIMLGANFFRIHRSHMVSRAYVAGFKAGQGSRYRLLLTIGAELPVGRSRVDAVIAWLKL